MHTRPRRSRRYLRPDNARHVHRVFGRENGFEEDSNTTPLVRSPAMLRHVLGNKRTCVEGWVQSVPRRQRHLLAFVRAWDACSDAAERTAGAFRVVGESAHAVGRCYRPEHVRATWTMPDGEVIDLTQGVVDGVAIFDINPDPDPDAARVYLRPEQIAVIHEVAERAWGDVHARATEVMIDTGADVLAVDITGATEVAP